MKQRIALLGSTGSIGEQTLDIIANNDWLFEAVTLTSNTNWEKLARQAVRFQPDSVVIADKNYYPQLREALSDHPIKVYAGPDALCQVASATNTDTVVNALVGYAGLEPTICALEAGKKLAIANKETLVVAGDIVMRTALANNAPVIPVDSEHSAIFQCLTGERGEISRIILTASGGPFRSFDSNRLGSVTVAEALDHPNWSMGNKISIDSATMMNKGFEVIEARWLFGVEASKIEVVIHPQSIIHSMVEFADGAIKAQMGTPDMHLPIQYALTYPDRLPMPYEKFSFGSYTELTFEQPDLQRFPALRLAYECLGKGGNCCCTLNAANEIAVEAFLDGRIGFTDIPEVLETVLEKTEFIKQPALDDYRKTNTAARQTAVSLISRKNGKKAFIL